MAMGKSGKTTTKDIAEAAGVSLFTVSAALNGKSGVGVRKRLEIQRIAAKMNYEPHRAAQLLRLKNPGQIGIVIGADDFSSLASSGDSASALLCHFIQNCEKQGIRYVIECHHINDDRAGLNVPAQIASRLATGSILSCDVGGKLRDFLGKNKTHPFVSVMEPAAYCVLIASDKSEYEAVRFIAENGHRRIAFAGGPERYMLHKMRKIGFRRAVRDFGMDLAGEYQIYSSGANPVRKSPDDLAGWCRSMFSGGNRPTAIFCPEHEVARTMICIAMGKGLRVPQDLSIVSLGHSKNANASYPALTIMEIDFEKVMGEAMEMLETLIKCGKLTEPVKWIEPVLIQGGTTAKYKNIKF